MATAKLLHQLIASALAIVSVASASVESHAVETANKSSGPLAQANSATREPQAIAWAVLSPDNGRPFTDPFAGLTGQQLSDLSSLARTRRMIGEGKIEPDGIDASDGVRIARKLAMQGIDVDWLMSQRRHVAKIRGIQIEELAESIAASLGNREIRLTGYAIPIADRQEEETAFYLLPTIAACSSEAAPSPLQAVFVSTKLRIEFPQQHLPVRVTGKIQARATTKTISNGIAMTTVQSAYSMPSPDIAVYSQPRRSKSPKRMRPQK